MENPQRAPWPPLLLLGLLLPQGGRLACSTPSTPIEDSAPPPGDTGDSEPPTDDTCAADTSGEDTHLDDTGTVDTAMPREIAGVHVPLAIDPDVDIQDNHWLVDAYRVLLDRAHDADGYRNNRGAMEGGLTREQMVAAFVVAAEFQASSGLSDRAGFVSRVYETLLGRTPSQAELDSQLGDLADADGAGSGRSWAQLIDDVYRSTEYANTTCHSDYYTLGSAVSPGSLLLDDLFTGRARLQTIAESEPLELELPSATAVWDQKLPVLEDPDEDRFIAFTRAYRDPRFDIALLESSDAVHFAEVDLLFERGDDQTYYDPHIAVDNGVCPRRWVMTLECLGTDGAASLCTSETTHPGKPETWSTPTLVVDGCNGDPSGVCPTYAATTPTAHLAGPESTPSVDR